MVNKLKAISGYVIGATACLVLTSAFVRAAVSVSNDITIGIDALKTLRRTVAEAYPNRPRYLLTFEEAAPQRNPTRTDIYNAVDRMEAGREGFVILERSNNDKDLMQAARDSRIKYDFEYSTYIADSAYKLICSNAKAWLRPGS